MTMTMTNTIENVETRDLPAIVAGLMRENLRFQVFASGDAWRILITGY